MSAQPSSVALEKDGIRSEAASTVRKNCKLAVKRGLPVIEFVRIVWGYTPEMIPDRFNGQPYNLKRDLVNTYFEGTERGSYTAFAALVTDLLAQLYQEDATEDDVLVARRVRAMVMNTREEKDIRMIKARGAKPDLTWSTIQSGSQCWRTTWESCLAFIEIKRTEIRVFPCADLSINLRAFSTFSEADESAQDSVRYAASKTGHNGAALKRQPISSPVEDERSIKRTCRRDSPALEYKGQSAYQVSTLDDEDFHAVLYVMEMLERNVRSYASGFSVRDTTVTLWYGDRMGLVTSSRFDLLEEPHFLLLVVAALGDADEDRFGVSPYLTGASFGDFDRSGLLLPPMRSRDAYGVPLRKQLVLKTYHPGVLVPGQRYVVVGAGTMIFPVKAITTESTLVDEVLIAKISWPLESSTSETSTLKAVLIALREKAPRYCKHVTEMRCYVEESFADHGLPRAAMLDMDTESPRRFVLMVMKKYEPLHNVASVSEFKCVFIDVVRGRVKAVSHKSTCLPQIPAHWWVAETADVLHADISVNNIMFYREDSRVLGVLMDWDHALARDPVEVAKYDLEVPSSDDAFMKWIYQYQRVRYWYTRPYVDIERQSSDTDEMPPHRYEHDLEAFFWVLMDFLQHIEPYDHKLRSAYHFDSESDRSIVIWKRKFLSDHQAFEDAEVRVHADYLPAWDVWVPRLREMFRKAYSFGTECEVSEWYIRECLREAAEEQDETEMAKMLSWLREKIRARKETVTYQAFMDVLGAPLDIPE